MLKSKAARTEIRPDGAGYQTFLLPYAPTLVSRVAAGSAGGVAVVFASSGWPALTKTENGFSALLGEFRARVLVWRLRRAVPLGRRVFDASLTKLMISSAGAWRR